jgi:hypothetical protein
MSLPNAQRKNAARWLAYLDSRPDPHDSFVRMWRGQPKNVVRWGSLTQPLMHGAEHRTHDYTVVGAHGVEPPDVSVGACEDEVVTDSDRPEPDSPVDE